MLRKSGNKHKNTPLVSTDAVCDFSQYIILYKYGVIAHREQSEINAKGSNTNYRSKSLDKRQNNYHIFIYEITYTAVIFPILNRQQPRGIIWLVLSP